MKSRKVFFWMLRALLSTVAVLTVFFLAFGLAAAPTWPGRMFLIGALVLLGGGFSAVLRKLQTKCDREALVTEIVGLHPSQLPRYKWLKLAQPKADAYLSALAKTLGEVVSEEEALLTSQDPDSAQEIDLDREIQRRKTEFWLVHGAFAAHGVTMKKSWKDYSF